MSRPTALTNEVLIDLYVQQELALREIARRFSITHYAVSKRLKAMGVPLRPKHHHCRKQLIGKQFGWWTVLEWGKYEKKRHHWHCVCVCGTKKCVGEPTLTKGESRSCGCRSKRCGPDAVRWRGGQSNKHGYKGIYVAHKKYEMEHRLVMEKAIGRSLHPNESVHHKNGIRDDNRLENLELWVSRTSNRGHPHGQRVTDRIQDAIETLQRYAPEKLALDNLLQQG